MTIEPDDTYNPPRENTEVGCLHCGEVYDSYRIEWRVRAGHDGQPAGFWSCPTPGCDGIGFGCDIFPTDPNWHDPTGRLHVCYDDDAERYDDMPPLDDAGDGPH